MNIPKILLNQDCRLLRFAIANKKIEAFQSILGAIKDDIKAFQSILEAIKDNKEILKEVLTAQALHRIFHYRTPLELYIYHYNQCSDYQGKSEKGTKVTNDVKKVLDDELPNTKNAWDYTKDEDFKIAKEFIETILNSAREHEILEDVLIASSIRKDLARELSDSNKKCSNDDIIKALQKDQKADEKSVKVGIAVALVGTVIAITLFATEVIAFTALPIIGAIVLVSIAAVVSACGVYTFNRPNTKMLGTGANQEVGFGNTINNLEP